MKKVIPVCILLIISVQVTFGQITEFTFSATRMLIHQQLDSVLIENLTQGGDTMLYYPDTVLVLSGLVGITPFQNGHYGIISAYPNPSDDCFVFGVFLDGDETVKLRVYNNLGILVSELSEHCSSGLHLFEFHPGNAGYYIVLTETQEGINIQKLCSTGGVHGNNHIRSTGQYQINARSTLSTFPWQSGDQLRFTGYVTIGGNFKSYEVIEDNPAGSQLYTFIITDGLPCNAEPIITDIRDGNQYYSIKIGNQCWMAENLRYLPAVFGSDTASLIYPLYHVYDYEGTIVDSAKARQNYDDFGVLYNWPAVMNGSVSSSSNPSGVQGVCPAGWHIPSDAEWKQMEMYVGMSSIQADATEWRGSQEGGKLKSTSLTYWNLPNTGATNSTSFSGMPGGTCFGGGYFYYIGNTGYFWSATENGNNYAWFRGLHYTQEKVYRTYFDKYFAFSVRCVRD